jgi:hypothetical protein
MDADHSGRIAASLTPVATGTPYAYSRKDLDRDEDEPMITDTVTALQYIKDQLRKDGIEVEPGEGTGFDSTVIRTVLKPTLTQRSTL